MLLNCIDFPTTIDSLKKILNITDNQINDFLDSFKNKVTYNNSMYSFEGLEIDEIKDFFNVQHIYFNEVAVHHVSAVLNKESYFQTGLLNLENLAIINNSLTDFLDEYGISLKINKNGKPFLIKDGTEIKSDYTKVRFGKDQCINGFLLGESAIEDTNVSHIRSCPELISHLGREILHNPNLEKVWTLRAKSSLVSFKVPIEHIDETTFQGLLNYEEKKDFLILRVLEYMLFKHTFYGLYNQMVFLNEKVVVPPEDILSIIELNDLI